MSVDESVGVGVGLVKGKGVGESVDVFLSNSAVAQRERQKV